MLGEYAVLTSMLSSLGLSCRRVFHTVSQHEECILQVTVADKTLSDNHKFKVLAHATMVRYALLCGAPSTLDAPSVPLWCICTHLICTTFCSGRISLPER